ncbi:hypothetical protein IB234_11755 [Pseudomonas sp. PDM16]|uniref:hypothetical protein n=1 Tax=Pseudomonas sp. PDM16 TaxID=2769292 RepID=UPI00178771BD|nr:hypothetical protein [Pseudomonas sp. PDM16]MBD9415229.1 hypothetical protein [Pseudomonas sp. PDM16]
MDILTVIIFVAGMAAGFYTGSSMARKNLIAEYADFIRLNIKEHTHFHRVFGVRGFFLNEMENEFVAPLAIIPSKELLTSSAKRELGPEATEQEIKAKAEEMIQLYLKEAKGLSEKEIAAIEILKKNGVI